MVASDVVEHCRNCPDCDCELFRPGEQTIPLHPILQQHVFQIVEVDIMDLTIMEAGNKHVVVFQNFLSKYPLVFPFPDH